MAEAKLSDRSMVKAKLQPVYLMSVIQYLKDIPTLFKFEQVSKNCSDAINQTKINPAYEEDTNE